MGTHPIFESDFDCLTDSQMSEVCDSPVRREVRYDRQLRLWGEHGQTGLESARVLIIGVNATTAELAKNLVLPGIGAVTLLDDKSITPVDLMSNFFYGPDSAGRKRAIEASQLLAELNPSVKCTYDERSLDSLLLDEPGFFAQFTLIIATRLVPAQLADLRKSLVPIVSIDAFGMFGRIRHFNREHCLFEAHPENTIPDVRLDRPFPELIEFCDSFNLSKLNDGDHKHVPYLVPLYKALQKWGKGFPASFQEKKQVREIFDSMRRSANDEENFDEGYRAAMKLLRVSEVPSYVTELLKHPKVANITPESDVFWCLLKALDYYLLDPASDGLLPLRPQLPDMTADSASYIKLTRLYHERAQRDIERFTQKLDDVCRGANVTMPEDALVSRFCHNIQNAKVLTQSNNQQIDYNDHFQDPDSLVVLNVVFDAILQFNQEHCHYPDGENGDADKSAIFEILFKDSSLPRNTNHYDPYVQEILRSGNMELHSVAAYLGGIGAQEVIKVLTRQYVPIDNTLFYSAISQLVQTYQF